MFASLLLEIGLFAVKRYIESSETKKDDKILDLAKDSVSYLAYKPNNTVSTQTYTVLHNAKMKQVQKAK